MAFRGHEDDDPEFLRDPFPRFVALEAALEAERGLFGDRVEQSLAALLLAPTPGDPAELAAAVRAIAERLRKDLLRGYFGRWYPLVYAVTVVRHGDDVDALTQAWKRSEPLLRTPRMRKSDHSMVAFLVLRILGRGAELSERQLARLEAIYAALERHNWWQTNHEDLPACALLSTRPGEPEQLAARADAIYRELLPYSNWFTRGFAQNASNLLAVLDAAPADIAARLTRLRERFAATDHQLGNSLGNLEQLATLCLLPRSPAAIAEHVVGLEARLREHLSWQFRGYSSTFAVNLAFAHLAGDDPLCRPIADVRALLDMYAIVISRG